MRTRPSCGGAGFTLLEGLVGLVLASLIIGGLWYVLEGSLGFEGRARRLEDTRQEAVRLLAALTADLRSAEDVQAEDATVRMKVFRLDEAGEPEDVTVTYQTEGTSWTREEPGRPRRRFDVEDRVRVVLTPITDELMRCEVLVLEGEDKVLFKFREEVHLEEETR